MAEVFFYHLTRSPLDQALPEILDAALKRDMRVVVRGTDDKRLIWLDERLWAWRDEAFLPHGIEDGVNDVSQPILLTKGTENPNLADVLVLIDGATATSDQVADYKRVCLMFDGTDENAVSKARIEWKSLTEAQVSAKYWAQEDGRWVMKAEKTA